jgi:hypothetical protein
MAKKKGRRFVVFVEKTSSALVFPPGMPQEYIDSVCKDWVETMLSNEVDSGWGESDEIIEGQDDEVIECTVAEAQEVVAREALEKRTLEELREELKKKDKIIATLLRKISVAEADRVKTKSRKKK